MDRKKRGRGRPEAVGKWLPHVIGATVEGGHKIISLNTSRVNGVWRNTYECVLCGKAFERTKGEIRRSPKSCGCRMWKQSSSIKRLRATWSNMLSRCTSGMYASEYYADRGIAVCEEWMAFPAFRDWALSNGYSDNLTIDRIDVNDGYKPSNCRFITKAEQTRNRRDTVLTWEKVRKARDLHKDGFTLGRICEEIGLPDAKRATVSSAIRGRTWTEVRP